MDEAQKKPIYCRNFGCWKLRCEVDGEKVFWCSRSCRDRDPVWEHAPRCPTCGRKCSPSNWYATHYYPTCGRCAFRGSPQQGYSEAGESSSQASCFSTLSLQGALAEIGEKRPTTRSGPSKDPTHAIPSEPRGPIRFYRKTDEYYEFTNFFRCPESIYVTVGSQEVRSHYSESLYQAIKVWYLTGSYSRDFWKILEMRPRDAFDYVHQLDLERSYPEGAARFHGTNGREPAKIQLMETVVKAKFIYNPGLRRMLLDTGSRELIEDSPRDSFWGVGIDGRGQNQLGKILVRVRTLLRRERS
jgi:ribA/ribD-fused uncharacterized protein